MPGDRLALGIDVGTSGIRAAALDARGELVAQAASAMAECGPDPRSPAVWRATLALTLQRLAGQVDLETLGALSVDGTSGTVLALDARGEPLGNALMYNDAVEDAALLERIGAVVPRESAAHGSGSALARACQLQRRPGVARIVHQADWIAELLAGAPVASDESNALKTGYDALARRWPDWLAQTPLHTDLLPAVVAVGAVTAYTAGAFGLPGGVVIVAGMTDGCASFMATGASRPGEGVTALGTTLTLKLLCERPIFAPRYGIYSHRIGDTWLAGGASNSGGRALEAHFATAELARLSARMDPHTDTGLDYYPLPGPGERFPVNDPALRPRTQPRPASDALFAQGLLEGIARIERSGYRRLAELGAPQLVSVRTVGGGAGNPAWTAIRRRILGVEFAATRSTAAAAGVARVALAFLQRGN